MNDDLLMFDLYEMLNTVVPVDKWETVDGNKIGYLTIHGKQFKILLTKHSYIDNNFINIGFEIWDEQSQQWSSEVTLTNKHALPIISAIINAIDTELNNHSYEALIFGATDNQDQRMRIYNWIMRKYSKRFGYNIENLKTKNGNYFTVVCSKSFTQHHSINDVMEIIEPLLHK